jgi:hypothetical protein
MRYPVRLTVARGRKVRVAHTTHGNNNDEEKKQLSPGDYDDDGVTVSFNVAAKATDPLQWISFQTKDLTSVDLVAEERAKKKFIIIGHYDEPDYDDDVETALAPGYKCVECSGGVIVCAVNPTCTHGQDE